MAAYTHSGSIVASDLTALIPYTKKYVVVPEDRVVKMTPYRMAFYDENGHEIQPEILEVNWDTDAAMKNGFPHFMLKEIHEQPDAMKNTILPRLTRGLPDFSEDGIPDQIFADCNQIRHCGLRNGHARGNGGAGHYGASPAHSGAGLRRLRVPL